VTSQPLAQSISYTFSNSPFANRTTGIIAHLVLELVDVVVLCDSLACDRAYASV
jgi:hypothetical protein